MDNVKTVTIKDSARTALRRQQKRLGLTAVAYLVELITNSDDSYKRLEAKGEVDKESVKPIFVKLKMEGNTPVFSVTDNAEGISEERARDIFSNYGGDNAEGGTNASASRGIFGQGATDVMINSALDKKKAMIESIKDGKMCKLTFHWDENRERTFEAKTLNLGVNQFKQIRENISIPANGTKVTFGVPDNVKFKEKTIIDELEGAYALRYILSSENREVIFQKGSYKYKLTSAKYKLNSSDLLTKASFDFNYDGEDLKCSLELYRNKNKVTDGSLKTNILVTDSKEVVFDNTMFGFDKNQKAKDISGILKIDGLYDLCKKHLNKEKDPDEILNDDRTGFNTKSDFYEYLVKHHIDKIMYECLAEHGSQAEEVEISKNKKIKNALSAINKFMAEELKREIPGGGGKGINPPIDGLDFGRTKIEITKGVSYDLKLIINASLITTNDDIFVEVENNNGNITFSPDVITFKEDEIHEGKVIKSVSLSALNVTKENEFVTLVVSSKTYKKSIAVYVVDAEIIYPNDGLDFELKEEVFTEKGNHKSSVWFDTDIFPLGTTINIQADSLVLLKNSYTLRKEDMVTDHIGNFNIISSGGVVGNDYILKIIIPSSGLEKAQTIHIRNTVPRDSGSKGMFTSIKLWTEDGADFQITFNEKTGVLYINAKNNVNKAMMGDLSNTDPQNPKFKPQQNLYLADLIAQQVALIDVKELERKNAININQNERLDDYMLKINEKKSNVFNRILKSFEES